MLDRIRSGDERALAELMAQCWSPLVRHLATLTGSQDTAHDAAQEALIRLWARRDQWSGGSAKALLFQIGRNAALDLLRRRRVRDRWIRRSADEAGSAHRPTRPDEAHEGTLVEIRVEEALSTLPPRRREVFELVRFAGMSYAEVAATLAISTQTVANHMSLALRDLRADLGDLSPPGTEGGRQEADRSPTHPSTEAHGDHG